jgi:hypothetical protein
VSQSIAGTSGQTEAGDLGWQRGIGRGELGLALTNMGPGLRVATQSFSLPTTLRAGASWPLLPCLEVSGAFSEMQGYGPSLQLGAHYRLMSALVFGLGYQVGDTSSSGYDGFSAGTSLEIGPFRADFGFQPFGMLGSVIQVGLGYRFGEQGRVSVPPTAPTMPALSSQPVLAPAPVAQPPAQTFQPADTQQTAAPAQQAAPTEPRWSHDW